MGEKSAQKKRYIIETAGKVFMEKGYRGVTMKDIVDACDISRGGLYLYFENTSQLFLEVLKAEAEAADDVFAANIPTDATVGEIIYLFLLEQKKELLRKENSLQQATYEFFFTADLPKKENPLKKQFDATCKLLEKLIETGVQKGELICPSPKACARNILFAMEGLKICAQTMGITEKAVDKEIAFLLSNLGLE